MCSWGSRLEGLEIKRQLRLSLLGLSGFDRMCSISLSRCLAAPLCRPVRLAQSVALCCVPGTAFVRGPRGSRFSNHDVHGATSQGYVFFVQRPCRHRRRRDYGRFPSNRRFRRFEVPATPRWNEVYVVGDQHRCSEPPCSPRELGAP